MQRRRALKFSGIEVVIRASADSTGGAFSIVEAGFETFFRDLAAADAAGSVGRRTLDQIAARYHATSVR